MFSSCECVFSYEWQNKVAEDIESLMIIKMRTCSVQELSSTITKEHPYDVPDIVAVPVSFFSALSFLIMQAHVSDHRWIRGVPLLDGQACAQETRSLSNACYSKLCISVLLHLLALK